MRPYRHRKKDGFTLIETALALMVASIGLLVVMGLFIDGLSTQEVTVDETQAAQFAEEVLNTVRALAPKYWSTVDSIPLPAPASDLWVLGKPAAVQTGKHTNKYVYDGKEEIEEFALRYKLTIEDVPNKNLKRVRLEIWNGEFGDVPSRVYYTEMFNTRLKT